MNQLQILNKNGQLLVASYEVSEMVDKRHDHLLTDIRKYVETLGSQDFESLNFFIPSTYINSQNKEQPYYLLTREGCGMIAHKLIGERGVLFTAAYVTQFEHMEEQIKKQQQQPNSPLQALQIAINQMVLQEQKIVQLEQQVTTVQHRINSLDTIDTDGDLKQRLNKMIQRLAWSEGISFREAWKMFRNAFNTAYRTNLKAKINNYKNKHGLKQLTASQYLLLTNQLSDAVRVADKLLNKGNATA
ncbi:hypothetical protein Bmyc01_53290 [Bacillus mycoides]|nr:hypothetical protein Bmyc01_53290 [Bacillus mycoides]